MTVCEVDSSLFYNHCGRNTRRRGRSPRTRRRRDLSFSKYRRTVCVVYTSRQLHHTFFFFFCLLHAVLCFRRSLRSSVTADELRSVQGAIVHPYRCQDEVPRRSRVCFQHRVLERRRQRGHHRGERPGNNNVVPNILGDYFTSPLSRYRVKHDALTTNTHQS